MRKLVAMELVLSAMFAAVGQEKPNLGVGTQFTLPVVFGMEAPMYFGASLGVVGGACAVLLFAGGADMWRRRFRIPLRRRVRFDSEP